MARTKKAAQRATQNRRNSITTASTARTVRSRSSSHKQPSPSYFNSRSQFTTPSRRSSLESLQGPRRKRVPLSDLSAGLERPVSVASSRTFAGDAQSVTGTSVAPELADADLDALSEVIMAVNLTDRGTVGCAYYVAREEKLYFMEDVKLGGPDIIDQRMYKTLPS